MPKSANASAGGTAVVARIKEGGGTTIVNNLTVGTSASDIILNSTRSAAVSKSASPQARLRTRRDLKNCWKRPRTIAGNGGALKGSPPSVLGHRCPDRGHAVCGHFQV